MQMSIEIRTAFSLPERAFKDIPLVFFIQECEGLRVNYNKVFIFGCLLIQDNIKVLVLRQLFGYLIVLIVFANYVGIDLPWFLFPKVF
jgi:hypothetical protein